MSEDEFDAIPDEFANIQGIDWAALLSGDGTASATSSSGIYNSSVLLTAAADRRRHFDSHCERIRDIPSPVPSSRSSVYFTDCNTIDSGFLAELDRVEQRIQLGRPQSSNAAQRSIADGGTGSSTILPTPLPDVEHIQTSRCVLQNEASTNVQLERPRSDEVGIHILSSRSGKGKASEIHDILSEYEDELTCPICCDLLVAAHVGNPCGHTFCGECGWHWHVEKNNMGCPLCRHTLDKSLPMIPNIAIDNTVEKHVKVLAISGATEWETEGRKYKEWTARKKVWQRGAQKRETRRRRDSAKGWVPVEVFDDWVDPFQDSDVELIPRPIRRARRRQPSIYR